MKWKIYGILSFSVLHWVPHTFRLFILKWQKVITNVRGKGLLLFIRRPFMDSLLRIAGDICGKCFLLLLSLLARLLLILFYSSTFLALPSLMP